MSMKIPLGYRLAADVADRQQAEESGTLDELCCCGCLQSKHGGLQHHGACTTCTCPRFTWDSFLVKM